MFYIRKMRVFLIALLLAGSPCAASPDSDFINTLDATSLEVYQHVCKVPVPPEVWRWINERWTYDLLPQDEEKIRSNWLVQLAQRRLELGDKSFCAWLRDYVARIQ